MMHKLAKMLANKSVRPLDDDEKSAKMDVLSHLKDVAEKAMSSPLHKMKKVEVMADSNEGLEHGLEKAHEMAEEHSAGEESPEQEEHESPEEESSEHEGDEEGMEHEANTDDTEDKKENEQPTDHHDDIHDGLSDEEVDAKLHHLTKLKSKRHAALKI